MLNPNDNPLYNAYGDGLNDDTAYLQAAHDRLPSSGGTIYLPNKKFKYTKLNITKPNVSITGEGILYEGTIIIGDAHVIKDLHFKIHGITFEFNSIENGKNAIELRNVRRGKIFNCTFKNADKVIYTHPIGVFQHTSRIMIYDNIMDGAGYILYIDRPEGYNDYSVGDFHFINNQCYGGVKYGHIYGLGVDGFICALNSFFFPSHRDASQYKKENIYIDFGNHININSNNLYEAGTEAIWLNRIQNPNINGNNIAWCGQRIPSSGIKISKGNQTGDEFVFGSISGNNIVFPTASGIELSDNVSHMSLGANTVRSAGHSQYYYGSIPLSSVPHFGINTSSKTKGNVIIGNNTDDNINNIQGSNVQNTNLDINKNVIETKISLTLTQNISTLDTRGINRIHFAQTLPTTITNLNNGTGSQEILLLAFNDNTTIQSNSSILLKGNKDVRLRSNESISLIFTTGKWLEVARNVQYIPNIQTLERDSTFIDVTDNDRVYLNQPNKNIITELVNGTGSQEILLLAFNDNTTIQSNSSIVLSKNTNITLPNKGIIKLLYTTDKWVELFRNF